MADFMLGLPRTVIPPTDQIQGHVGGWRNGFFINDNWQARRNLTLSLGLRYERSTPVQTYAGVADMLAEDFLTIIPSPNLSAYPVKGFEFTEPNNKDFAPRLGATYRLSEKTVVRAGYGIYYNPNQMNSFTFLTNNPPMAVVSTYTNDPDNPTLSFEHPTGTPGAPVTPDMISPTRHLPNARKDQWSFDVQRELWASGAHQYRVRGLQHQPSRSQLLQQHADAGPWRGRSAAADVVVQEPPHHPERPHRRLRCRDRSDCVSGCTRACRPTRTTPGRARATCRRTRTAAARRWTTTTSGGTTARPSWDIPHRFVASYLYDIPFLKSSTQPLLKYLVAGWQVSGVTTIQSGSPLNVTLSTDRANIGITGQQRPDLVGPVPEMNCVADPDPTKRRQLMNCFDQTAFALPAQFTFGNAPRNVLRGPGFVSTDLSFMKNRADWRRRAVPVPRRVLQHLQQRQLRQSEYDVCRRKLWPHHLRRQHAAGAARGKAALLIGDACPHP